MKLDTTQLGQYFRYGFIPENNASKYHDILSPIWRIKSGTQESLSSALESRFYNAAKDIKKIAEETKRHIFLWISWWIDSLLIYKIFKKLSIDFTWINLSYGSHYSEKQQVLESTGESENDITFIEQDLTPLHGIQKSNTFLFPNVISHPTIIAYSDIAGAIPRDSILVTWDLWDEIFGETESDLTPWAPIPEYVFDKSELSKLFPRTPFIHNDIITNQYTYITEIWVFFLKVTYSMWSNVTRGRNILYLPFYKYFLNSIMAIKEGWFSSQKKHFLYELWDSLSLSRKHLVSAGITFPVAQEMNRVYFEYIYNKQEIISSLINIDMNYVESLLQLPPKKAKWKLFSLVLFINYLSSDEHRFFKCAQG